MAPTARRMPVSRADIARPWTAWTWIAVPLLVALAPAAAQDRHYTGVAYAEDGSTVRYREEHWLYREGDVPTRLVLYRCPSGEPFARKLVHERGDAAAPDFDFVDARDGYREGARREGARWLIYVRKRTGAPMDTGLLAARQDMVIDAGFDAYVREHWAQLAGAARLGIAFVVPSRLDYLNLQLGAARDTRRSKCGERPREERQRDESEKFQLKARSVVAAARGEQRAFLVVATVVDAFAVGRKLHPRVARRRQFVFQSLLRLHVEDVNHILIGPAFL